MPRTSDIDPGTAESVVFDNLDVSREDMANEIEDASENLQSESDGDYEPSRDRGRDRESSSERSAPQKDPYPERMAPQQKQRDDLGRDRRVSHTGPVPSSAEVHPDQHGNLIGPDGTIVARAGREARLYQRAANEGTERIKKAFEQEQYKHSKVYQDYQTLQGKMGELDGLLRSYEERDEAIKGIGLNPEHQVEAMRLFKQLTNDYPGTLKKLLTQAASRGVDVAGMAQSGIDPKALTDAISEKFEAMIKPMRDRTEAEQAREVEEREAQQRQTELEGEVKDFFMQNRDAVPHMPVFLRVLEQPQYQNMTLGEIWARIQLSMARSGRTAPNVNNRNAGNGPAVPNGRSHPQMGNSEMAPVSQTYEAILKEVINEAGFGPNRR